MYSHGEYGRRTAQVPAGRHPDERPTHRWGLGAFLAAEAVFLLSSFLMVLIAQTDGIVSTVELVLSVGIPSIVTAIFAGLITLVRGNGVRADLRFTCTVQELKVGAVFGFGGLFITIPAAVIYASILGSDASSAVGEAFSDIRAGPLTALLVAALVIFVAPICEEILYRGLLWGALARLGLRKWPIFAITTVIFALFHFEPARFPLLLIVAVPIGLARIYSRGLLAAIVAHQINNILPGIGLYLILTGSFPV